MPGTRPGVSPFTNPVDSKAEDTPKADDSAKPAAEDKPQENVEPEADDTLQDSAEPAAEDTL